MKQKLVWCKDMLIEIEPCNKRENLLQEIYDFDKDQIL
jgi:hypothetical protein